MKRFIFLPLMTYFILMNAMAADGENNPSNLLGAPVNTALVVQYCRKESY
ncbi:hypothetical protein K8Y06_000336 [Salmonella enterica]|nr:hypothetical protein [Salmonella enterica]EIB4004332.1 hypothetical protein [Salmonella enterica]MBE8630482.1 hypothetical protein [Salmonella enterica subsp. enterica serovar Bahrenfeld]